MEAGRAGTWSAGADGRNRFSRNMGRVLQLVSGKRVDAAPGASVKKRQTPQGPPTWDTPEYRNYCETHGKRLRIKYADAGEWGTAWFVYTWRREDGDVQRGQTMSASSGPKDYLNNDALALFADPEVTTVTLLVLNGTPFMVRRKAGLLVDRAGCQVVIEWGSPAVVE